MARQRQFRQSRRAAWAGAKRAARPEGGFRGASARPGGQTNSPNFLRRRVGTRLTRPWGAPSPYAASRTGSVHPAWDATRASPTRWFPRPPYDVFCCSRAKRSSSSLACLLAASNWAYRVRWQHRQRLSMSGGRTSVGSPRTSISERMKFAVSGCGRVKPKRRCRFRGVGAAVEVRLQGPQGRGTRATRRL